MDKRQRTHTHTLTGRRKRDTNTEGEREGSISVGLVEQGKKAHLDVGSTRTQLCLSPYCTVCVDGAAEFVRGMSPSQEEAEWKEEADSMLEETVPQCMEMDMGMDEGPVHVVESTAIKTTASCSCPTAVVAEATAEDSSTRSRKGSRRDSLPFPLPPTVVSSGKSEAEAVSLGEEQGERGSLAQVDYYKRVDDKV